MWRCRSRARSGTMCRAGRRDIEGAGGVRCFYDGDEVVELWGKDLAEELSAIYGEQSAAVVVFISAEYVSRDWTLWGSRMRHWT